MSEPTEPDEEVRVVRDDDANRYRIEVGGVVAGFTAYRPKGDRLVFVHTEIDGAFSGRGLGRILVAEAMADVAARGEEVVPRCPFVATWLRSNEVPGLVVDWPTEP